MKKIPKFKTQEEAAKYWETHSFEDYHKDTKNGEIVFIKKAKKPGSKLLFTRPSPEK